MIRKWRRETESDKVKLENFFFCIDLETGAKLIAALHLTLTIVIFVVLTTLIVTSYETSNCFSPVYVDFVVTNCYDALQGPILKLFCLHFYIRLALASFSVFLNKQYNYYNKFS